MASRAFAPGKARGKSLFVNIFMAGQALGGIELRPFVTENISCFFGKMAVIALELTVLSDQFEMGIASVIKFDIVLPSF